RKVGNTRRNRILCSPSSGTPGEGWGGGSFSREKPPPWPSPGVPGEGEEGLGGGMSFRRHQLIARRILFDRDIRVLVEQPLVMHLQRERSFSAGIFDFEIQD